MATQKEIMVGLEGMGLNRYEAVLLASKRARMINADRLAKMEMMADDSEIPIDYRKVASIALEDLLEGKVKKQEG